MNITQIIPTAEPFFLPGNEIGCLLIHGFTGTPKEMRMLGEYLNIKGYTVLAPRLFAHATNPEDMLRAKWRDWLASVEDGFHILKNCTKHQVIIGLSMGGILGLTFSSKQACSGLITISTPFDLSMDPRSRFLKYLYPFYPKVPKGPSDNKNVETARDHIDYPYYPSKAIVQLNELIEVMHQSLPNINLPALFIQSRGDLGIPGSSLENIYNRIGSQIKKSFWVENSGHVIIEDVDKNIVFEKINKFILDIL